LHDEKAEEEGLDHFSGVELDRVDHRLMGNSDHGTTYIRVGGDNGELRPWHYIYVYSIKSRPMMRFGYDAYMTRRPRRKVWIIFPALNLIASITVFDPCGPGLFGKAPAAGNARNRTPSTSTFPRAAQSQ